MNAQASPEPTTEGDTASSLSPYVTFSVADELFAVPMAPVQEIIRVPTVAAMPLAPAALAGLANLRGRVLPIVDLRRMCALPDREHDDGTRAIVVNVGQTLGFIVDRVHSVISVDDSRLEPATHINGVIRNDFLSGVLKRPDPDGQIQLHLVLDFERLVAEQFTIESNRSAGLEASAASAQAPTPVAADSESTTRRLVSFTVADQEYGLHIDDVREIVQVPEHIVGVPHTAGHMLGLISLRDRLLPLICLRAVFGQPRQDIGEHHRIVVVALPGGHQIGLVTDAVKEVLSVDGGLVDEMPGVLARDERLREFEAICRLDGGSRLVSIICTDRLLGLEAIQAAVAEAASPGDDAAQSKDSHMHESRDPARADDDDQIVIFRLGSEEFGVPIMCVQEIVRVPETLTSVPHTPDWVEGVINLRGTVLPVVDQRARFGLPRLQRQEGQRIMVYSLDGVKTGFIVDSVAEVLRLQSGEVERAPNLSDRQGRIIRQVAKLEDGSRLVMLLDPVRLLGADELDVAGEINASREAATAAGTDARLEVAEPV